VTQASTPRVDLNEQRSPGKLLRIFVSRDSFGFAGCSCLRGTGRPSPGCDASIVAGRPILTSLLPGHSSQDGVAVGVGRATLAGCETESQKAPKDSARLAHDRRDRRLRARIRFGASASNFEYSR
jgi:hypothetical protein